MSDEPAPYTTLEHHDRIEFQVDRLILFTDAVFAIAITLLAIELRVPELRHLTDQAAWDGLLELIPKFVGFLMGFFVIATYWMAHHRLFRFVRHYDDRLLWLNMLFLLAIVLMPFTSGYFSEYTVLNVPYIVYSVSVISAGMLQLQLQAALRDPRRGYVHPADLGHPDLDLVRPLIAISVFLLAILLTLALPHNTLSRLTPILIFPGYRLYARRYRRLKQQWELQKAPPAPVEE
ncbi:MAG: TMEM175 family protein [Janthinobacterium lividum]